MNNPRMTGITGALCCALALLILPGCDKPSDAVSAAKQADKKAGIAAPGIAETKAIAEEAFSLACRW